MKQTYLYRLVMAFAPEPVKQIVREIETARLEEREIREKRRAMEDDLLRELNIEEAERRSEVFAGHIQKCNGERIAVAS